MPHTVVTSATTVVFGEAIRNPVVLSARIGSPAGVVAGTVAVLAAQITTSVAPGLFDPLCTHAWFAPFGLSFVFYLALGWSRVPSHDSYPA